MRRGPSIEGRRDRAPGALPGLLLRALGARRRDVIEQFMREAALICGVGALLGLVFGGVLAYLIAWALLPDHDGSILAAKGIRDGDGWGITILIVIAIAAKEEEAVERTQVASVGVSVLHERCVCRDSQAHWRQSERDGHCARRCAAVGRAAGRAARAV